MGTEIKIVYQIKNDSTTEELEMLLNYFLLINSVLLYSLSGFASCTPDVSRD
jgi:hypothetical protein